MIQKDQKTRKMKNWKKRAKNDPLAILRFTVSPFKTRFGKFFNSKNPLSAKKRPLFLPPPTVTFRNPNDHFLSFIYENAQSLKNGLGYI